MDLLQNKYGVRLSTRNDYYDIMLLLSSRMGEFVYFYDDMVQKEFDNKFYVALDGEKIIAVTGLEKEPQYRGNTISWTAVHPKYEHKGIITDLIRYMLDHYTGESDILCSCWKTKGKSKIHLQHSMDTLGFKLVLKGSERWDSRYNCSFNSIDKCVYKKNGVCKCTCDIYELKISEYRNKENKDE